MIREDTRRLLEPAVAELKTAGAREVYLFGSAARGASVAAGADLDLAVAGLPPQVFYRTLGRVMRRVGCPVDLVDLDAATPFARFLREKEPLVRIG
jgi:predicted nucleotidyltransferase